jgi:hypothetical protein
MCLRIPEDTGGTESEGKVSGISEQAEPVRASVVKVRFGKSVRARTRLN